MLLFQQYYLHFIFSWEHRKYEHEDSLLRISEMENFMNNEAEKLT